MKKKALADQLEQQLKNGASFASARQEVLEGPGLEEERRQAHDLAQGQTVPPFDKVAFSLKTNADLAAGHDAVRLAHHPGARRR